MWQGHSTPWPGGPSRRPAFSRKAFLSLAGLSAGAFERLSSHGLRAGFITECYKAGARDEEIMGHTRHKDLVTMRGYVRRAKLVTDSATKLLDL